MSLGAASLNDTDFWPKSIVIGKGTTTIVEFSKLGVKLKWFYYF